MKRDPQHLLFGLSVQQYSLKGLNMLCILYAGSLVFAALSSPVFFKLVHESEAFGSFLSLFGEGVVPYLKEKPLTRHFDRARLLAVIVILPLLFKYAKLYSLKAVGFRRPFSQFPIWYAYGLGMMVIVLAATTFSSALSPVPDWSFEMQAKATASAVIGATLLSLFEEVIFRGLVFRLFYSFLKPIPAILLSSLFFGSLHFKMDPSLMSHIPAAEIGFDDGFRVALGYVTAVADGFTIIHFINYCLVGIILHQVFILSGNLWSAIGLHAGWVTVLLSLNKTFEATENTNVFTGSNRVIDGYWVTIVMSLFVAFFAYLLHKRRSAAPETD
ncbi:CPBP family intramembrane glutamic endopeptidase [Pelagicoccus sp. SDUM812005]|uniref:CPBP family intramembrane glutamic endopeptidase n=1 Tax=Pelagicoccus sp. SDUM812005 TaxID=3041257 RepID=UPI00280F99CC|nr:CPBP family intramembrane glutamic endopeptidase [Pelagicoccus sp. SDUM812005]MDQ8180604.1 CPBP family intramembrane metalloprotease [Pelagicoccus sp. SDUM812005]